MDQAFHELDNSPVGRAYKKVSGGTKLSEAKQTWWGTIGANTLQGGQALANIIIHPIQTTKAVGQFARHPIDSTKQVASMYKDEWNYSNGWGKVGVAWRGAFEVVFGAKGAGTVSKVGKIGYQAGRVGKLGTIAQKGVNALGAIGTLTSEVTPEIVTKTFGGMSTIANKVSEKVPQRVKSIGREQSRIGMIDDPLDNLARNKQGVKTEKTASIAGESEVIGEKLVREAGDLIPLNSPEYKLRLSNVIKEVERKSPQNIARIEAEFLDEGVQSGWFKSSEEGKQILNTEIQRLTEKFNNRTLELTNNFSIDFLEEIFEAGKLKTKFDTNTGWFKKGKADEKAKRIRVEDNLGIEGLNPKYAGLDGGTGAWGEVQALINPRKIKDQSTFSHYDSFFAGTSKEAASTSQLTLSDAIKSKAILNIEKRANKKYNKIGSDKVYTEAQILGEVRLGKEVTEIRISKEFEPAIEILLQKYPQYKNLIIYE